MVEGGEFAEVVSGQIPRFAAPEERVEWTAYVDL